MSVQISWASCPWAMGPMGQMGPMGHFTETTTKCMVSVAAGVNKNKKNLQSGKSVAAGFCFHLFANKANKRAYGIIVLGIFSKRGKNIENSISGYLCKKIFFTQDPMFFLFCSV